MKDKLLNAMSVASALANSQKRMGAHKNISFAHSEKRRLIKEISDPKHFSKDRRLFDAMYLTAFGL